MHSRIVRAQNNKLSTWPRRKFSKPNTIWCGPTCQSTHTYKPRHDIWLWMNIYILSPGCNPVPSRYKAKYRTCKSVKKHTSHPRRIYIYTFYANSSAQERCPSFTYVCRSYQHSLLLCPTQTMLYTICRLKDTHRGCWCRAIQANFGSQTNQQQQ